MILIDSYGWIEYFANGPLAEKYSKYIEEADIENTITPVIVVYEVYKKVKLEKGEEKAMVVYAQIARTKIVPINESIAMDAADFSLELKLGMADAIIYATAKREKAKIVTSDKHFKGFEDVEIIK